MSKLQITRADLTMVVVGVDPATTSDEDSDETGIVVVGKGPHQSETCAMPNCRAHGYVLEDATVDRKKIKPTPQVWAKAVVDAFHRWDADLVVIEKQPAGEMGRETIWTVEKIPVQFVNAKDGKRLRAEPISMLYDQGRVHHVGDPRNLLVLEEQMTTWVEGDQNSPDRLDAMVYALLKLEIRKMPGRAIAGVSFEKSNPWAIE